MGVIDELRGRAGVAVLVFVAAAGAAFLGPANAAGAQTYMSCGYPPTYSPSLGSSTGRIHYVRHPRHCSWSDNSFTYRLVILRDIRWRRWGKRVAVARGKIVDNHDMDQNGFQHHPVRIRLSNPRPPLGHSDDSRLYYTRMRVVRLDHRGLSIIEHLFRPGEHPVVVS